MIFVNVSSLCDALHLERGEISRVHQEIAIFEQIASRLRRPDLLWYSQLFDAMIALLVGRFADAEDLADQFRATGLRAQDKNAIHSYAAHLAVCRFELGRADQMVDIVRSLAAQHPTVLGWPSTLAFLLAETGQYHEARDEFERLARHNFTDFSNREGDSISLNLLASTCVGLNDLARAKSLYDILSPLSQLHTVIAYAVAYFGPVADRLGQLASILERWDDATTHFQYALASCKAIGALPWLAHVQHNYARALLRRNRDDDRQTAARLIDQSFEIAQELRMAHLLQKLNSLS